MSYDPDFSRGYLNIRNTYDAGFNNPTEGAYNSLKGSIYEFKSTNLLPNNMYDSLNNMQQNFGQQLSGLEKKLY